MRVKFVQNDVPLTILELFGESEICANRVPMFGLSFMAAGARPLPYGVITVASIYGRRGLSHAGGDG